MALESFLLSFRISWPIIWFPWSPIEGDVEFHWLQKISNQRLNILWQFFCLDYQKSRMFCTLLYPRTTDAQRSLSSLKSRTFGLGQTNWSDKFWGIWSIFGRTISTHFAHVFHYLTIISTKNKPLYPHSKYLFGIGIWIWIWIWIWAANN